MCDRGPNRFKESEVETLIILLLDGRPVRTGTAIYTLSIGLDGEYRGNVQADKRIDRAVKQEGAFRGHIVNAENIGKTSDDLVERWNKEHPDDPIT
ncbi:MAG: hypothetical protein GY845_15360 [Planctomycetes bacterium]|nr:hypothetical protein [Planctomycetota bacterium]